MKTIEILKMLRSSNEDWGSRWTDFFGPGVEKPKRKPDEGLFAYKARFGAIVREAALTQLASKIDGQI